jgi:hypothetical protein
MPCRDIGSSTAPLLPVDTLLTLSASIAVLVFAERMNLYVFNDLYGGAERDRTADLVNAIHVLPRFQAFGVIHLLPCPHVSHRNT